ncbi:MAG: S1C family serine protease [Eubacteriales bacterium]|nr:S1C family serine protease [Eubacteriales bacterium]
MPTTSPGTSSTLLVTTSNSSSASSSGSSDETKPTGSRPIVTDDKDHPLVTLAWTEIFEQVNPSVAMIRLTIPASSIYEKREETFSALIIDEEGLLISSYSMFEKAVDYRGILMDGASVEVYVDAYTKPFPATMYGFDTMSDIALLKVEPDSRKLTAQALSRKSEVKVGLPVGVITAPEDYVLKGSLIPGHVMSVKGPAVRENGLPYSLFVTDVPTLNKVPGAPLVDEYGRVVGICSASNQHSYLDYRTYVVPAPVITKVVDHILELAENPPALRPMLGIAVMSDETAAHFSQRYEYPMGLFVTSVQLDSPADVAGLREGDIILSINEEPTESTEDLIEYMEEKSIGSYCVMKVYRPSEDAELYFSCYLQQARN